MVNFMGVSLTKRHFNLALLGVLLLTLLLFLIGWSLMPVGAATPEVGIAPAAHNAYEFVGRIDQDGFNFTGYGYLTYIRGLDNSQLFTNPITPTEGTAHFTFFATATLTSRAIISNIFVIDSLGPMTFYYQSNPQADFNNPTSFASGTPIATASVRFHNILNVQGPNQGIATNIGEVTQFTATPFTLGQETYQLGRAGLLHRLSATGQGTRTDPVIPRSFVLFAGNAVTIGQDTFLPLITRDSP